MEPRPKGEPAALQAVAAQLSSYASRLDELAAVIPGLVPPSVFIGPARSAQDAEFEEASSRARAAAHTLSLEAKLLAKESGELARKQRDWDRRKREEEERAERKHREAERAAGQCLPRPSR